MKVLHIGKDIISRKKLKEIKNKYNSIDMKLTDRNEKNDKKTEEVHKYMI